MNKEESLIQFNGDVLSCSCCGEEIPRGIMSINKHMDSCKLLRDATFTKASMMMSKFEEFRQRVKKHKEDIS